MATYNSVPPRVIWLRTRKMVNDRFLLNTFLRNCEREMNDAAAVVQGVDFGFFMPRVADLNAAGYGWRGKHANFKRI